LKKKKFDKGFLMLRGRVNEIKYLIQKYSGDPQIRQIAANIVTKKIKLGKHEYWKIPEEDYINELNEIFKWVKNNIRYELDPLKKDIIEDPFTTMRLKLADCDGMTVLVGSLVGSLGYPVAIKVIKQSERGRMYHVYPLVGLPPTNPKRWLAMDTSLKEPIGYQVRYIKKWIIRV